MKLRLSLLLLASTLAPSALAGKVNIQAGIDVLAFDGKESSKQIVINDHNKHQLVVRLAKVVKQGSEESLFESRPVILTFNGTPENLNLTTPRIITMQQAESFNSNPTFTLKTDNGTKIPVISDHLKLNGFLPNLKIIDKLAEYNNSNQKASVVFAQSSSTPVNVGTPVVTSVPVVTSTTANTNENQQQIEKNLKSIFIQADKATQKRFLEWAKAQK